MAAEVPVHLHPWMLPFAWPGAGYLAWAWMNHALYRANPASPHTREKWLALGFCLAVGPFAFLTVRAEMQDVPRKFRRGLRFW